MAGDAWSERVNGWLIWPNDEPDRVWFVARPDGSGKRQFSSRRQARAFAEAQGPA